MRLTKLLVTSLITGCVSFSSLAATELTKEELAKNPDKYEKIGTITTAAETTAPMDAKTLLSKRADEKGGQYYVIIAAGEHDKVSALADVYRDKK